MDPITNTDTNVSQATVSGPDLAPPAHGPGGIKNFLSSNKTGLLIAGLVVLLLINLGVSAWLFHRVDRYSALSALGLKKSSSSSSTFNGDDTLYIDTSNKSVGVAAPTPEGLQVGSDVTQTARGTANVRLGLLNGQPVVLFEDANQLQWQLGLSDSSLQLGTPGNAYLQIDKTGNTTLGNAAANSLTIQAASVAAPNNLNIGNNALFVDSAHGSVAIGTNNAAGYKLYVSGNFKATGSIQSGGQITGVAGSAAQPGITFAGNTNTGIFSAGSNIVSITSAGNETLRVQPGNVSTLDGAGLTVNGFLQSGGNSPAWQIVRFTGTLDGSGTGTVAHGISNASSRVIMAMAWYQGGGGTAKPLSIDLINGTNFEVSGGLAGAPWRGAIMYTADTAGW